MTGLKKCTFSESQLDFSDLFSLPFLIIKFPYFGSFFFFLTRIYITILLLVSACVAVSLGILP